MSVVVFVVIGVIIVVDVIVDLSAMWQGDDARFKQLDVDWSTHYDVTEKRLRICGIKI